MKPRYALAALQLVIGLVLIWTALPVSAESISPDLGRKLRLAAGVGQIIVAIGFLFHGRIERGQVD